MQPRGLDIDMRPEKRILVFVSTVCFIDLLGIGIILPVMPALIGELTGAGLERAAVLGGWLLVTYAAAQFLAASLIGALSDRWGRRPVLLGALVALALDYALMAIAPTLAWLFVGRAISGALGATAATANACVADAIAPERRGRAFGIVGAASVAGFIAGPAVGGALGLVGTRWPFAFAAAAAVSAAVSGTRWLPETLARDRRRPIDLRRVNPIATLRSTLHVPAAGGLLAVVFAIQFGTQAMFTTWSFYTIAKFDWSPWSIGLSTALFGLLSIVVQGMLTGRAIVRFGEARVGLTGLCFAVMAYLVFALGDRSWLMYVGMVAGAISNLSMPAILAIATAAMPSDRQGELQAAIATVTSITAIIGPICMAAAFRHFADPVGLDSPGAPFALAAVALMLSIPLYLAVTRRSPHRAR